MKKKVQEGQTGGSNNRNVKATSSQITAEEPESGHGRGGKAVSQEFSLLMMMRSFNMKHISPKVK